MNKKILYIGLGVVAIGGLAYFMMRKKGADETTSEGTETKSAEATDQTSSVTPTKGSALTTSQPATPTCGCGTGQTPCPNVRCASKTSLSAYKTANTAKVRSVSPQADSETETFAFTLNF